MVKSRMQRIYRLVIVSIGAATVVMAAPTSSASAPTAKQDILREYDAINRAFEHKDLNGVFSHYTGDMVTITETGQRVTLVEKRKGLAHLFNIAHKFRLWVTITEFSVRGNSATTTIHGQMEASVIDPQTGRVFTSTLRVVSKDRWVKVKQHWLIKEIRTISQTRSALRPNS